MEQRRVAGKIKAAMPGIGARNIKLVSRDAFRALQNTNHFRVIFRLIPENVDKNCGAEPTQGGKLFFAERSSHDILQPYRVNHAAFGLPKSRRWISGHRVTRESLDNEASYRV